MGKLVCIFILSCVSGIGADESIKFAFFSDVNYGYLFGAPDLSTSYFTTPSRSNEFNLNLAVLDSRVETQNLRATLALHAGTSVYKYFTGEARDNTALTPQPGDFLAYIHEADLAYQLLPQVWLNAGIWEANLAGESLLSSRNYQYTRSMIADFSPYFQSGIRLRFPLSEKWRMALKVVNGFRVAEFNGNKLVGGDFEYKSKEFSFSYYTLWGEEIRLKILNNWIFRFRVTPAWETQFIAALSFLKKPDGNHYAYWWTFTANNRLRLTESLALGFRAEVFWDKYQVNAVTNTPRGFQTAGLALNIDKYLTRNLLWRNEIRFLSSVDSVFATTSGPSLYSYSFVTSLAFTIGGAWDDSYPSF